MNLPLLATHIGPRVRESMELGFRAVEAMNASSELAARVPSGPRIAIITECIKRGVLRAFPDLIKRAKGADPKKRNRRQEFDVDESIGGPGILRFFFCQSRSPFAGPEDLKSPTPNAQTAKGKGRHVDALVVWAMERTPDGFVPRGAWLVCPMNGATPIAGTQSAEFKPFMGRRWAKSVPLC